MKVLVKWKKSILFLIFLLMILVVYITIGSKTDEKSKFGYTVYERSGAVTHVKALDLNIVTPKDYIRFFRDSAISGIVSEMKKRDMDFLAVSKDYSSCREFYFLSDKSGISDSEAEDIIKESQGSYSITSDLTHDDLTLGDLDFHRVCYSRKDNIYLDYGVVAEYFTEHDGRVLEIRCYTEYAKEPDYANAINEVFTAAETDLSNYSYGTPASGPVPQSNLSDKWKSLTFAPWILLLPFLYALFCGITYTGYAEKIYDPDKKRYRFVGDEGSGWNEDFLSRSTSKMLLGFFSILIVFHHLVQQVGAGEAGLLCVLEDFGVGFVGVFFFFSGFGLYESFRNKKDYLKDFLAKRLPTVLIPFYTVNLIFVIYEISTEGMMDIPEFLACLLGWTLLNSHMWYIVEIVVLYLIFYLLFRYIKNRRLAIGLLFLLVAVMVCTSLLLGHGDGWFRGEWWYNTAFMFPTGVLFSEFKDGITYYMKRFYHLLIAAFFCLFIVLFRATEYMLLNYGYWSETGLDMGYDDKLRCLAVQFPMVFFFVLLLLLIGLKLKIGNKFLSILGSISLELYLIHALFFSIFSDVTGTGSFFLCVIVCSLLAAGLLHYVHTCILCAINKKPLPDVKAALAAIPVYIEKSKEDIKSFHTRVGKNLDYCSSNKRKTLALLFRYVFCIFLCVLVIIPVGLLVINSTKSMHDIVHGISFLPGGKFAENYMAVKGYMESLGLSLYEVAGRSVIISVTCTVLGTYIGGLCAYGFEYYDFRHKRVLWWVVMAALMMPATAGCVGFMKLVIALHLYDHLLPIIVTGITIPSCVFFLRMYLHTLRIKEIIESARIDGCPELRIFNRIILPIMRPAIFLQLIINFANSWNNTLYQSYIMVDVKKRTLAVFLNTMAQNRGGGSDPEVYTTLLVSTIPSLIMFIIFSKGITANINLGGIKE